MSECKGEKGKRKDMRGIKQEREKTQKKKEPKENIKVQERVQRKSEHGRCERRAQRK